MCDCDAISIFLFRDLKNVRAYTIATIHMFIHVCTFLKSRNKKINVASQLSIDFYQI